MDVTCERCQTEYEFDETLVSDGGTTVKCTNCGHLFKIFRSSASGPAVASLTGARPWTLRRRDGTSVTFDRLATLQQWILEGRTSREDEISRTGGVWKKLGTIAELAAFFAAAEGPPRGVPPAERPPPSQAAFAETVSEAPRRRVTPAYGTNPTAVAGAASHPPTRQQMVAPAEQAFGGPISRPVAPRPAAGAGSYPPAQPVSSPPPGRRRTTNPNAPMGAMGPTGNDDGHSFSGVPSEPPSAWGGPALGDVPAAHRSSMRPRLSAGDEQWYPEDENAVAPRRTGRIAAWLLGGVLLVVVAYLVVFQRHAIGAFLTGAFGGNEQAERGQQFYLRGREAFLRDTPDGYDSAERELTKVLAVRENDARALAGLAEVLATSALYVRDEADDVEAKAALREAAGATAPGEDPRELRGQAARLREEFRVRLERAQRQAAEALRADPNLAEANRASALTQFLAGDSTGARAAIERARIGHPNDPETGYTASLVALADPARNAEGRSQLEQSVRDNPRLVRGRVRIVRVLMSDGRVDLARQGLNDVLLMRPEHPVARRLAAALEHGDPPLRAGAVAPPAAPAPAAVLAPPTDTTGATAGGRAGDIGTVPASGAGPSSPSSSTAAEVPGGRSYDYYFGRAEEHAARGSVAQAVSYYQRAIEARPTSSEALSGLGFCLLSQGNVGSAIGQFRSALQQNPNFSQAYFGLGQAAERQGDPAGALRSYNRYLDINPEGSHAAQARAAVDRLGGRSGAAAPPPAAQGPAPSVPPTGPRELPAPQGMAPGTAVPEDVPAVGSEPPNVRP